MIAKVILVADTPQGVSAWERGSRSRWKAAVRRGTIFERRAHVVRVREHVANVERFLMVTRLRLSGIDVRRP